MTGTELALSIVTLILGAAAVALMVLLLTKKGKNSDTTQLENTLKSELKAMQSGTEAALKSGNSTLVDGIKLYGDAQAQSTANMLNNVNESMRRLEERQNELTRQTEQRMSDLKGDVMRTLSGIQQDNNAQLEKMRGVVDTKLQTTLEQRLTSSFGMIGERLEKVHEGLGEMRALSQNVTDLKKVMSGVKTRGIWGEISLGSLLEQILSPAQYKVNARLGRSNKVVEFAVVMPGQGDDTVLMPIDSKFPMEDYQRLVDASESGNKELYEAAAKALEDRVKSEASDIKTKYVAPPYTVDFGVLYLPVEGLFAEVVKRPGLMERLRDEYKVMVAGPTTFTALLNSLQLGFKSLAIEKNSREILKMFNRFKHQFEGFTEELARTQKNAEALITHVKSISDRTRVMEGSIGKVLLLDDGKGVTDDDGTEGNDE